MYLCQEQQSKQPKANSHPWYLLQEVAWDREQPHSTKVIQDQWRLCRASQRMYQWSKQKPRRSPARRSHPCRWSKSNSSRPKIHRWGQSSSLTIKNAKAYHLSTRSTSNRGLVARQTTVCPRRCLACQFSSFMKTRRASQSPRRAMHLTTD